MTKKDVNTKKSRLINVQISLIAMLCFGYWMYEVYAIPIHKPKKSDPTILYNPTDLGIDEPMGPFTPEQPENATPVAKTQPQKILDVVEPVKDDTPDVPETNETDTVVKKKIVTTSTDDNTSTTASTSQPTTTTKSSNNSSAKVPSKPIGINAVDMFPVHPDCAKFSNNKDILECFEKKLQRLVRKKFDDNVGADNGLTGKHTVRVYFEIDKNGNISRIKGLGKHKVLNKEAERVAKFLPKMEPARKGGKKVTMAYVLPITLDVQ